MKKSSAQLSPVFIILSVIAVSFFSYAMYNLSQLPTPEEKRKEFDAYNNELMIAEEAQVTGKTIEEIKNKRNADARKQQLKRDLQKGVESKNDELIIQSLKKLGTKELGSSYFLHNAMQLNNESALHLLLKNGVPCNYSSYTGGQAFAEATRSSNPKYIEILLDYNCSYDVDTKNLRPEESPSLEESIIKSPYPLKIYQLSEKHIQSGYKNKAFSSAICRGYYEQVASMLKLGANPNTYFNGKSPLHHSLICNKPKISFLLIEKGADILSKSEGRHVLTMAFAKGEIGVVKELLSRDPNYINRENIEHSIISSIFHLNKNKDSIRASISLLTEKGVSPSSILNKYPWLRKAINLQDSLLAEQLLELGNGLYDVKTIQKSIKYIEKRDINVYHKNKIIELLKNYASRNP